VRQLEDVKSFERVRSSTSVVYGLSIRHKSAHILFEKASLGTGITGVLPFIGSVGLCEGSQPQKACL
jgi:hypothetical protein